MNDVKPGVACGVPRVGKDRVTLLHGEGGRVMRRFLRDQICRRLGDAQIDADAAGIDLPSQRLAITTDSYVVSPLFFPGGDIGSLAVHGTVNDLSVAGADPKFMTLSLIIEEGFRIATLDRVMTSIADAASRCQVSIVAGDTKVVPKGAADGLFINTTGVGVLRQPEMTGAANLPNDAAIVVSGPIGRHGLAVLCERESLGFSPSPTSDSAPLHEITSALQVKLGGDLYAMRDATRGGLGAVLHEWAESSGKAMWVRETDIPLEAASRGVCEILGLDPMFIANEGTFVAAVAANRVDDTLAVLRSNEVSSQAAVIGQVRQRTLSPVIIQRTVGVDQPLDEPLAAMLPRIC